MLKLYDKSKKFLEPIVDHKDLCVETELETGVKTLSFQLPLTTHNLKLIQEEMYIQTKDYEYVIKEVNLEGNAFFDIFCSPNIETLSGTSFRLYEAIDATIAEMVAKAIEGTGWTAQVAADVGRQLYIKRYEYVSAYEVLKNLRDEFTLEYYFDTKRKVVEVYKKKGSDKGVYYSNEVKLKKLVKQSESYDFVTKLVPVGKDGLNISQVNRGKDYIEDYSYSNKVISSYWVREDIDRAEDLLMLAQEYLSTNCQPKCSYQVDVVDFGQETTIGDTVTIVDSIKRIRVKQRVVKIIEYPQTPEKNRLEISNLSANMVNIIQKQNTEMEKKIAWIEKNLKEIT